MHRLGRHLVTPVVLFFAIASSLPALAGPRATLSGQVHTAELHVGRHRVRLYQLDPGASATLSFHGSAHLVVWARRLSAHPARVALSITVDGRERTVLVPRSRDRKVRLPGTDFVSGIAAEKIRLHGGAHTIVLAWPSDAVPGGLLGIAGVSVTLKPTAAPPQKPVAQAAPPPATPPVAERTPPVPPKAAPPPAPKKNTPSSMPLVSLTPARKTPPAPAARAAAKKTPKGYERIEAYGDREPDAGDESASAPAHGESGSALSLTAWGGAVVPLYKLSVGPAFGLALSLDLGRAFGSKMGGVGLDLELEAGWSRVITEGPAIVPGRGIDAGFTQDSHVVPVSLMLAFRPMPKATVSPVLLAGIGTVWTDTNFIAFSAPQAAKAFGLEGVFGLGAGLRAGPGRLGLEVLLRVAGVDLGPLGQVGETSLSGVQIAATYSLRL